MTYFFSTEEVTFEVEDGDSPLTGVWVANFAVSGHTDNNYGADSDGNRGTSRDFIDDYNLLYIEAPNGDRFTSQNLPKVVNDSYKRAIERIS